jgi:hypothetical protein
VPLYVMGDTVRTSEVKKRKDQGIIEIRSVIES